MDEKEIPYEREPWYSRFSKSKSRIILVVGGVMVLAVVVVVLVLFLKKPEDEVKPVIRSIKMPFKDTIYTNGAVASDSGRCSETGRDILKEGGTAMDAAVATEFCLGLMLYHNTGIGGGGFALVYIKETGKMTAFNFREKAPSKAKKDMFINPERSSTEGGLATAVPGFVKGLRAVWKSHGKLPWKRLLEPSIKMADDGFEFSHALYSTAVIKKDVLYKDPGLREIFFDDEGNLKKEGEKIKDRQLAETMREIARDPDSFYTGKLAKDVARDVREAGGIITEQDLKDYTVEAAEPISLKIENQELFAPRPPSSGAVLAMILNILQGYDFRPSDLDDKEKAPLTYHRMVEAFKFAYAYRSMLGDEAFVNVSVVDNEMLRADKMASIRKKILDNKTHNNESYYGGFYAKPDHGTSHSSFISSNGDAVALTSTINLYFGAKYRSKRTGILYNDQMDDFSTPGKVNVFGYEPSPNNYIEPGKRPMSSMSPVIVLDENKQVRIVSGASGGSKIISGSAQTLINALWFNRTAWEAVTLPRLHHQLLPNEIRYTKMKPYQLADYIVDGLRARGHKIISQAAQLCNTQTITKDKKGRIFAKSDPRKGAWAAGY